MANKIALWADLLGKGTVKTAVREASKQADVTVPEVSTKADALTSLKSQATNLNNRMEGAGIDSTQFTDKRNPLEKALNLRPNQNWVFDIFEGVGRGQQALFGAVTEELVAGGKTAGEGFMEGLTGANRDYSGGGILRAATTGSAEDKGFDWTDIAGFGLDVFADPADIAFLGAGKVVKGLDTIKDLAKGADGLAESALKFAQTSKNLKGMTDKVNDGIKLVKETMGSGETAKQAYKGTMDTMNLAKGTIDANVLDDLVEVVDDTTKASLKAAPKAVQTEFFTKYGKNYKMLMPNEKMVSPSDLVMRGLFGTAKTGLQVSDELLTAAATKFNVGDVYSGTKSLLTETFSHAKGVGKGLYESMRKAFGGETLALKFFSAKYGEIDNIVTDVVKNNPDLGLEAGDVGTSFQRFFNLKHFKLEDQQYTLGEILESDNVFPYTDELLQDVTDGLKLGDKKVDSAVRIFEQDGKMWIGFTGMDKKLINRQATDVLDKIHIPGRILSTEEIADIEKLATEPWFQEAYPKFEATYTDMMERGIPLTGVDFTQDAAYTRNTIVANYEQSFLEEKMLGLREGQTSAYNAKGEFIGNPAIMKKRKYAAGTQEANYWAAAARTDRFLAAAEKDMDTALTFSGNSNLSRNLAKEIDNARLTPEVRNALAAMTNTHFAAVKDIMLKDVAKGEMQTTDFIENSVAMFDRGGKLYDNFVDAIPDDATYDLFIAAKKADPEGLKKALMTKFGWDDARAEDLINAIGDDFKVPQALTENIAQTAPEAAKIAPEQVLPTVKETPQPIVAPTKVLSTEKVPLTQFQEAAINELTPGLSNQIVAGKYTDRQIADLFTPKGLQVEGMQSGEKTIYKLVGKKDNPIMAMLPEDIQAAIETTNKLSNEAATKYPTVYKIGDETGSNVLNLKGLTTEQKNAWKAAQGVDAKKEYLKSIGVELPNENAFKASELAIDRAREDIGKKIRDLLTVKAPTVKPIVAKKLGDASQVITKDVAGELDYVYEAFKRSTSTKALGEAYMPFVVKPAKDGSYKMTEAVQNKIHEMLSSANATHTSNAMLNIEEWERNLASPEMYETLKKLDMEYGTDFTKYDMFKKLKDADTAPAPKIFKRVGMDVDTMDEDDVQAVNDLYLSHRESHLEDLGREMTDRDREVSLLKPKANGKVAFTKDTETKIHTMIDEGLIEPDETSYNALKKIDDEFGTEFTSDPIFDEARADSITTRMDDFQADDYINRKQVFTGEPDGTFNLSDGTKIDPKERPVGYQVSFERSTDKYTEDEFNKIVEDLSKELKSDPEIGVYKGAPEISFYVTDSDKAEEIMKRYNQETIRDWGEPIEGSRAFIKNPDYNPDLNQAGKAAKIAPTKVAPTKKVGEVSAILKTADAQELDGMYSTYQTVVKQKSEKQVGNLKALMDKEFVTKAENGEWYKNVKLTTKSKQMIEEMLDAATKNPDFERYINNVDFYDLLKKMDDEYGTEFVKSPLFNDGVKIIDGANEFHLIKPEDIPAERARLKADWDAQKAAEAMPKAIMPEPKVIEPQVTKVAKAIDPKKAIDDVQGFLDNMSEKTVTSKEVAKGIGELQITKEAQKAQLEALLKKIPNVSQDTIDSVLSDEGLKSVNDYLSKFQEGTLKRLDEKQTKNLQALENFNSNPVFAEDIRVSTRDWIDRFSRSARQAKEFQAVFSEEAFGNMDSADALVQHVPFEEKTILDVNGSEIITHERAAKIKRGYVFVHNKEELVRKMEYFNILLKDDNFSEFAKTISKMSLADGDVIMEKNVARILSLDMEKDAGELLKIADFANNLFKRFKLLSLGFNIRNLMGVSTNMWLSGVPANEIVSGFSDSHKLFSDWEGAFQKFVDKVPMTAEEQLSYDTVSGFIKAGFQIPKTLQQTMREGLTGSGSELQDLTNLIKGKVGEGTISGNPALAAVDKISLVNGWGNETVDAYGRMIVYRKALDPDTGKAYMDMLGVNSPEEAVILAMFDPKNISANEKLVMKRVIPFYTFTKMNLVYHMENLPNNARRYYRLAKAINASWTALGIKKEDIEDYKLTNMYIPLPGMTKDGKYYTIKANLPQSDLAEWVGNPLQRLVSATSPLIKAPFEMVANKQMFSGSAIEDFPGQKSIAIPFLTKKQEYAIGQSGIDVPLKTLSSVGSLAKLDITDFIAKASGMGQAGNVNSARLSAAYKELEDLQNGVKYLKQEGVELPTLSDLENKNPVTKQANLTLDQLLRMK